MEHIWTMLMHRILQKHLLCAFVANLKIDAIYAFYPEGFCDKNLAFRIVFAFSDSVYQLYIVAGNAYVGAKVWKSSFLAICKMQVPPHHMAWCESGGAICTESKGSTLVSRGRALSPCTRPLLVPH